MTYLLRLAATGLLGSMAACAQPSLPPSQFDLPRNLLEIKPIENPVPPPDTIFIPESAVLPHEGPTLTIPIGGNAWVTPPAAITTAGLVNWTSAHEVARVYVRCRQGGNLRVSVQTPTPSQGSTLGVKIGNGPAKLIKFQGSATEVMAGEWPIATEGYQTIELSGVNKNGSSFPIIQSLRISGTAAQGAAFVPNNEGNFFYWGRRGPSVHLNFKTPAAAEVDWFYTEITVPEKNDVQGSYFMTNGFAEGYMGIQVNSPTERRILFSVWSPFSTDDPKAIPPDQRIILLKKGEGVYAGEFGNEGSGGQSYLNYMWKAGTTYKLLLNGKPTPDGYTTYTAYFYATEENRWRLLASFKRPKTTTYLKSLHSFLENFDPATGDTPRQARYHNQWVHTTDGHWLELTQAMLSADNTARKGYRMDFAGGSSNDSFYMKNCGFFSDYVLYGQVFTRQGGGVPPSIDFGKLP